MLSACRSINIQEHKQLEVDETLKSALYLRVDSLRVLTLNSESETIEVFDTAQRLITRTTTTKIRKTDSIKTNLVHTDTVVTDKNIRINTEKHAIKQPSIFSSIPAVMFSSMICICAVFIFRKLTATK